MGEIPRSEQPEGEQKQEYSFEWMKLIEPYMVSGVGKLKDLIEEGEYSALISDDAGGRIPTLVMKRIIEERSSNKDIKTYFVGKIMLDEHIEKYRDKYEKTLDYFRKMDLGKDRTLVVSEFLSKGGAFAKIKKALKRSGKKVDLDFFTLSTNPVAKLEKENSDTINTNSYLFSGGGGQLNSKEFLDGVETWSEAEIIPTSVTKRMEREGKSDEEIAEIKEKIRLVREHDVPLMAQRVIEQVWEKEENK